MSHFSAAKMSHSGEGQAGGMEGGSGGVRARDGGRKRWRGRRVGGEPGGLRRARSTIAISSGEVGSERQRPSRRNGSGLTGSNRRAPADAPARLVDEPAAGKQVRRSRSPGLALQSDPGPAKDEEGAGRGRRDRFPERSAPGAPGPGRRSGEGIGGPQAAGARPALFDPQPMAPTDRVSRSRRGPRRW